jgi:hypothetical protein
MLMTTEVREWTRRDVLSDMTLSEDCTADDSDLKTKTYLEEKWRLVLLDAYRLKTVFGGKVLPN